MHNRNLVLIPSVLFFCLFSACEPAKEDIYWRGLWLDYDHPVFRGEFTADLEIKDEYEVTGTLSISGSLEGTWEVTGVSSYHYSGNDHLYHDVEIENGDGSVRLELTVFESDISNDALMYGSLIFDEDYYGAYAVPAEFGMMTPESGFKADLYRLERIAVKPGKPNTLWARGKKEESDPEGLYSIADEDGTVTGPLSFTPPNNTMTWFSDNLWFIENNVDLTPYDDTTFSKGTAVELQSEVAGSMESISSIAFSTSSNVCGMTSDFMINRAIEYFNPLTGLKTGSMGPSDQFTDLDSVTWAEDRYVFIKASRSGHLPQLLAYNPSGTLLGQFVLPVYNVKCTASDGTYLYMAGSDGWIIKVPLTEITE